VADHTRINIKDVEDAAPMFGFAPDMEARFATKPLELAQSGVSYQRLGPRFRQPFGHRHKRQEEVYVVVAGSGRLRLDDEIIEVAQWDAVRVPPGVIRCFEGGEGGIEYLAFGAPGGDPSVAVDAEQLPNWWTD
jgi:mannose-6-phosphate isomerase-like protein (cupin superfamily)